MDRAAVGAEFLFWVAFEARRENKNFGQMRASKSVKKQYNLMLKASVKEAAPAAQNQQSTVKITSKSCEIAKGNGLNLTASNR